ncbi:MAG: alpha-amylase [Bacteroidales bacterium]|nr:alpha-amylase [Bacteroidales bacterium]
MKEIVYQILTRLWGPGSMPCGKFSHIDAGTLSYLKGLGVSTVWYTGIPRHAAPPPEGDAPQSVVKGCPGSPYAISDWYDVNPYLSDNAEERMHEFESLIKRTHDAGMKVCTDFVPNHVARIYDGSRTPEGVPVPGRDDDPSVHWAPDNDFYYYPGEYLTLPVDSGGYSEYPAKASGNCFSPKPGINDWYDTVRLNYCDFHTPTWDKMLSVILFWAGKGVDAFRCDMVEMVPWQFFAWMIPEVKKRYPCIRFIAEVYDKNLYHKYLNHVGFDILYDKSGLYDTLRAVTCSNAPAGEITAASQQVGAFHGRLLNFLENHDEQRIASPFFAGSAEGGFAALAVSLLLDDSPFMLYAGQEAGERGGKDGRTSIFNWERPKALGFLWENIHGSGGCADSGAILERYRSILNLAVSEPSFREGRTYDLQWCQDSGFPGRSVFAWLRSSGDSAWLAASNFSGQRQDVEIRIPQHAVDFLGLSIMRRTFRVSIPPRDFSLLKLTGRD